ASVLGYLANQTAAGREAEARAWLAAHALPDDRAWLARWARDLKAALAATPGKAGQSQAREVSDAMN
ncbi:MAG TPA: hypothetical protein VHN99_03730, partial [Deinococcales bacterium]|nr:hypothetical protein [Deinococcales bacterium]